MSAEYKQLLLPECLPSTFNFFFYKVGLGQIPGDGECEINTESIEKIQQSKYYVGNTKKGKRGLDEEQEERNDNNNKNDHNEEE